jgi:hypothetical protein
MKSEDMNKAQAAYTLEVEIANMQLALDKAKTMIADVVDNYFNSFTNPKDHEQMLWIANGFNHNGTYAQIAMDYVYQALYMASDLLAKAGDHAHKDTQAA